MNVFPIFKEQAISFKKENIHSVSSHKHVILQGLDIVMGAMQFRLNDLHKVKPEGQRIRGKRTIAKEAVYKHISKRIRDIYPNFNIGMSTSFKDDKRNIWIHPYRHWCFKPLNYKMDESKVK